MRQNSRGHSVRLWAPVGFAEIDFLGFKLFFDTLLVKTKVGAIFSRQN